jgi:hypothetical protein
MKNINLRAVGVAALSTVAFSMGAVLPAMAQTAPTPPTAPNSVRTDILIPTPPTRPTPPTAPTAPQVRGLLLNMQAAIRAGDTVTFNRLRIQAIALLAPRNLGGR